MRKNEAISLVLVVVVVAIFLVATVAVVVETGFLFRRQNASIPSQTTQTTVSTQLFVSPQFLSSSYFVNMLGFPAVSAPVGIASYGLYNYSGSLRSYSINTSEVIGEANISALSSSTNWDYSIARSFSTLACVQCASLQMNVNVVAKTANGNQIFWVQNAVPFSNTTSHEVVDFHGLIFNMTTSNANVSSNSYGNGRLGELEGKSTYGFGSFLGSMSNYSLPLHVRLGTLVETYAGIIEIRMSDNPFGNGTFASNNDTFGIVNIPIKNVTSVSIVVMPSLYPWQPVTGLYPSYDSELVWTAYCCGQTTNFVKMNSSLSLQYLNSNSQLQSYPSFYTFGYTGESATNLKVTPYNGGGQVTVGENNNSLLSN